MGYFISKDFLENFAISPVQVSYNKYWFMCIEVSPEKFLDGIGVFRVEKLIRDNLF